MQKALCLQRARFIGCFLWGIFNLWRQFLSTPLCGCLQIVKLSDAVQDMPRSVTQFVHGVPGSFLAVGEAKAKPPSDGGPRFTKGAYFIGKVRLLN